MKRLFVGSDKVSELLDCHHWIRRHNLRQDVGLTFILAPILKFSFVTHGPFRGSGQGFCASGP